MQLQNTDFALENSKSEQTESVNSITCVAPPIRIHQILQCQHASTDDAGMSKHRLSPYDAYYHNWQTLNFTASDSSSDKRCFSKMLIHREP